MNDINAVFMIGRLTKEPELRYMKTGMAVCSFSIANNRIYKTDNEKKEQVSYFNCVAWAKAGEIISEHCHKGDRIGIEGRLQQRSWENSEGKKQYTVEIIVENFQFLSGKVEKPKEESPQTFPEGENPFSETELPF